MCWLWIMVWYAYVVYLIHCLFVGLGECPLLLELLMPIQSQYWMISCTNINLLHVLPNINTNVVKMRYQLVNRLSIFCSECKGGLPTLFDCTTCAGFIGADICFGMWPSILFIYTYLPCFLVLLKHYALVIVFYV